VTVRKRWTPSKVSSPSSPMSSSRRTARASRQRRATSATLSVVSSQRTSWKPARSRSRSSSWRSERTKKPDRGSGRDLLVGDQAVDDDWIGEHGEPPGLRTRRHSRNASSRQGRWLMASMQIIASIDASGTRSARAASACWKVASERNPSRLPWRSRWRRRRHYCRCRGLARPW
jgi:hypothetical protein